MVPTRARGRDKNPSPQVLEALARVLRLDGVERTYPLGLAAARPRAPRRKRPEHVPARVHELLAHLQIPAFAEGRAFDVLASNPAAVALSPACGPARTGCVPSRHPRRLLPRQGQRQR